MPLPHNATALAYSYIRFSTPAQADGDSIRRQIEAAKKWCDTNGVSLDNSVTLRDLGKSAYLGDHRKNPDRHALAGFLKLVEDGKVPRGSALVVESLDRLSREHIRPALTLLLNLIEAGIRVVQLIPVETVYDEHVEPMSLMMAIMELSRGHSESAVKSERVGKAWAKKKERARGGEPLGERLPAWVKLMNGKLELVPDRAATVRRIFNLATAGYGFTSIVTMLNREKVPPIGDSPYWVRSYIAKIVTSPRAIGEYQPRHRDGSDDGEVIPDYFPAVVTKAEFHAANAAVAQRRNDNLKPLDSYEGKPQRKNRKTGPANPVSADDKPARFVNVFMGLVRDGIDGDNYFVVQRNHPKKSKGKFGRVMVNSRSRNGMTACRSFPYFEFERAVLSCLSEVKASDVLGQGDAPDETMALSGELADIEMKVGELECELMNGDVAALARVLRQLEGRKREVAGRLAEARQRAASPLSEAWGNCQSLLSAVEGAADPDDVRVRLRSVLKRVVESISIVIVARGRPRLCAAQVEFTSGVRRSYLILHDPPRANKSSVRQPGKLLTRSFTEVGLSKGLNLHESKDATSVETFLSTLPLDTLMMPLATATPKRGPDKKTTTRKVTRKTGAK